MSYLIKPKQAKGISEAVWLLEMRHQIAEDDDIHLSTLNDGTAQIRIESTSSDVKYYIAENGLVASDRWDD